MSPFNPILPSTGEALVASTYPMSLTTSVNWAKPPILLYLHLLAWGHFTWSRGQWLKSCNAGCKCQRRRSLGPRCFYINFVWRTSCGGLNFCHNVIYNWRFFPSDFYWVVWDWSSQIFWLLVRFENHCFFPIRVCFIISTLTMSLGKNKMNGVVANIKAGN